MTPSAIINKLEASAYTVPTDAPEADATAAWGETTLVLVEVWAEGFRGVGWTYGSMGTAALIRQTLAPMMVGRSALDIGARWSEMLIGLRNIGRPGIGAMALSAVDCALWDLKARLLHLPLHRLVGAVREQIPVYGSGGFTSYDNDQLVEQLQGWVEREQLHRVKIKVAGGWGTQEARDLERVRLTREVVGPDVEVYVDANGGYTLAQAIRIGHVLDELQVRWYEEPVSSDDLAGLRQVRVRTLCDVTAGEYGYGLDYFHRLTGAEAVDCLQVDVTRCGGITELLRIAALAAAHHLEISGHSAPFQHAGVLAGVPNLRHVEWFHDHVRIERWFFDGTVGPVDGCLPLQDLPGHGLTFRAESAAPFRVF
jgi:L-alanine-DL-glutamate epimerase-like enolase superfamily enzyme